MELNFKIPEYLPDLIRKYVKGETTEDAECEVIDNSNCIFDVQKIEARLKELGALEEMEEEYDRYHNTEERRFTLEDIEKAFEAGESYQANIHMGKYGKYEQPLDKEDYLNTLK
jgi:hypothetical protein